MSGDTILALSTPAGASALAVIRISGSECITLTEQFISKRVKVGAVVYAKLRDGDEVIDDVVIATWKGPHSYTGEDVVEITCHGNMVIVERILKLYLERGEAQGVRMARAGEFTERAFLNDKMDLTQAEAVMELIHAKSERALQSARALQSGVLSGRILLMQERMLELLAHLEAYIDFPEEDISPDVGEKFQKGIAELRDESQRLLSTAREGKMLREGIHVVLLGAPNAGKSSLLNALVHRERAIVSQTPGTTRDTVEEEIVLDGIPVRLIDTAGVRGNAGEIEEMGIEKTYEAVGNADLILCLVDGADIEARFPEIPKDADAVPVIFCKTKADLPVVNRCEGVEISTANDLGLNELRKEIRAVLAYSDNRHDGDRVTINARHESHLKLGIGHLDRALEAYGTGAPPEFVSSDLRQALDCWGEIVGKVTNEDMLDRLFSQFCIGK